jgi:hypothetical protein
VLLFITKITTPSRLVAKSGFFAGSSTDDWGRGTGATGFWEPIRVEGRQEQMPLLDPSWSKVEPKPRRERACR